MHTIVIDIESVKEMIVSMESLKNILYMYITYHLNNFFTKPNWLTHKDSHVFEVLKYIDGFRSW